MLNVEMAPVGQIWAARLQHFRRACHLEHPGILTWLNRQTVLWEKKQGLKELVYCLLLV